MVKRRGSSHKVSSPAKKTIQGNSKFTKRGHKGGGESGSTTAKGYKKKYRGQGK
jgi:hypothetical protein